MAQKVKVTDASGTHQTVNTTTIANIEVRDVAVDQEFTITIVDSTGAAETYSFIGRQPKR